MRIKMWVIIVIFPYSPAPANFEEMAERWLHDQIRDHDDKLDIRKELQVTKNMSRVKFHKDAQLTPSSNSEVHFTVTDGKDTIYKTGRMDEIIRYNAQYRHEERCTGEGTIKTTGDYDPELRDSIKTTLRVNMSRTN